MKNRIRQYLQQKGMSQRELAKILGLTEVTVSRYALGRREPKLGIALKIAKTLGCTIEDLYAEV